MKNIIKLFHLLSKVIIIFCSIFFISGCTGTSTLKGYIGQRSIATGSVQVSVATLANNQLSLTGAGLDTVTQVQLTQLATVLPFTILSQTATHLLASLNANATLQALLPTQVELSTPGAQSIVTLTVGLSGTSVTNLALVDHLTVLGSAAPAVSTAASGRIYFDSALNKFKVSENGGAYVNLVTASTPLTQSAIMTAITINTNNLSLGSLQSITTGSFNSAFGLGSLSNTDVGLLNSAFGYNSLFNNTNGQENSAFGSKSLYFNSGGSNNSAFGSSSLYNNTSGANNSAFGKNSLTTNSAGTDNAAFGFRSLAFNTYGNLNSALGSESLIFNTSGFANVGLGASALYSNDSGSSNVAVGYYSMGNNTAGSNNTVIGDLAGATLDTGNSNILIGANADVPTAATNNYLNIGNTIFGNLGTQFIGIGVINPTHQLQLNTDDAAKPGTSTWIIASDERLKDIRAPFTRGLKEILQLNTIYFHYKKDNALGLPSEKEYVGIKAQEVKKVIPEAVLTDEKGFLHLTTDAIIWSLVNASQELYKRISNHDEKLAEQVRELASLKSINNDLKLENESLKKRLDQVEKKLNIQF